MTPPSNLSDTLRYRHYLEGDESASSDISFANVLVSFTPILILAAVGKKLNLGISLDLLIAGVRCMVQLSILGLVLYPFFTTDNAVLILAYIYFFMVVLSGYEATARAPKKYPGIMWHASIAMGSGLTMMGALVLFIVAPTPWYNAQYLIPLAGMLINNALTGTSTALKLMLEYLVTHKDHLETLLSFGATPMEASWPGFVSCYKTALLSTINGMNVIGLVTIPGMMTGQILGGASPGKAARYQIVIMFLIAGGTSVSIFALCAFCVRSLFDTRGRLDTSRVKDNNAMNIGQLFSPTAWRKHRRSQQQDMPARSPLLAQAPALELRRESCGGHHPAAVEAETLLLLTRALERVEAVAASPKEAVEIRGDVAKQAEATLVMRGEAQAALEAFDAAAESAKAAQRLAMRISSQPSRTDGEQDILVLDLEGRIGCENRPLRCKMSIQLHTVSCVMGPSGIGKPTLLKIVNDMLAPGTFDSSLKLCGVECRDTDPQRWRCEVLYVHQSSGALPGTPQDLIRAIESLTVRRGMAKLDSAAVLEQWSLSADCLERSWNKLSGGERQRVMLAIAVSTRPQVLLLDEPTSALDDAMKEKVEATIQQLECAVLLVTHDRMQAQRVSSTVWQVVEASQP